MHVSNRYDASNQPESWSAEHPVGPAEDAPINQSDNDAIRCFLKPLNRVNNKPSVVDENGDLRTVRHF